MLELDTILSIFDDRKISLPSGLVLRCMQADRVMEIAEQFKMDYAKNCETYLATLAEEASDNLVYDQLPSKDVTYTITGSDIEIAFGMGGYQLFSIDSGRNLPAPDECYDFDHVLDKTLKALLKEYPDVKYEGLFAWTYDNGVDREIFWYMPCTETTNEYAVSLLTQAFGEEDLEGLLNEGTYDE